MFLRSKVRTSHPLIRIRRLLDLDPLLFPSSLVRRTPTAAAGADEPEECSSAREEDGHPCGSEHRQAETTLDAIIFEDVIECGCESGEENGGYQ